MSMISIIQNSIVPKHSDYRMPMQLQAQYQVFAEASISLS